MLLEIMTVPTVADGYVSLAYYNRRLQMIDVSLAY